MSSALPDRRAELATATLRSSGGLMRESWMSGALQAMPVASTRSTIIVAEDNDMVRGYFVDVLEVAGYEVLAAGDGLGAFELLRERPDARVLLTDIEMPGMDGLYVSGGDREKVARQAVPGSLFLAKPCMSKVLCEAVAGMLDKKQRTV